MHVKTTESLNCLQHGYRHKYLNKDIGMNYLHTHIYIYIYIYNYLYPYLYLYLYLNTYTYYIQIQIHMYHTCIHDMNIFIPCVPCEKIRIISPFSGLDDHETMENPCSLTAHFIARISWKSLVMWPETQQFENGWSLDVFLSGWPPVSKKKIWKKQFFRGNTSTNGGWFFHI